MRGVSASSFPSSFPASVPTNVGGAAGATAGSQGENKTKVFGRENLAIPTGRAKTRKFAAIVSLESCCVGGRSVTFLNFIASSLNRGGDDGGVADSSRNFFRSFIESSDSNGRGNALSSSNFLRHFIESSLSNGRGNALFLSFHCIAGMCPFSYLEIRDTDAATPSHGFYSERLWLSISTAEDSSREGRPATIG